MTYTAQSVNLKYSVIANPPTPVYDAEIESRMRLLANYLIDKYIIDLKSGKVDENGEPKRKT